MLGAGLGTLRPSLWLASLVYLADAAAILGDAAAAEALYAELAPYEGSNVMIGHLVVCYGAADRYLGMMAAQLGDWERAERHFMENLAGLEGVLEDAIGFGETLLHVAAAQLIIERNVGVLAAGKVFQIGEGARGLQLVMVRRLPSPRHGVE